MDFDLIKKGYSVEFLRGKSAIEYCCICNKDFIDEKFEKIALDSIEDKDAYGIFVKKGQDILTTLIFIIEGNECEIILLCSNEKYKIGAATTTMNYFLSKIKDQNIKKIKLKIAKENLNKRAFDFYTKFGFKKVGFNLYELTFH